MRALDAGATDYVTKPFSVDELARARARAPAHADAAGRHACCAAPASTSTCCRARWQRDGHPVRLSAKEFELLVHFMRHPNQVLSREQLPERRLGLRLRPADQRRRGLRRLPAQEARAARPARPDRDDPLGGLPVPERGEPLAGLRPRITLLVAAVVAVCLLAGVPRRLSPDGEQASGRQDVWRHW